MSRFGPAPRIDATAVRPVYTDLPVPVRERVQRELGGAPVHVGIAGGGFTNGFAALLRSDSGAALFVKAAGPDSLHRPAYEAEARHTAALPAKVPAPRVEFAADVDGWAVTGYEAVQGVPVALPMSPETVRLLLSTWADAVEALNPPPAALRGLAVKTGRSLKAFRDVAAGARPFPLPAPLSGRRDELAALESRIDEVLSSAEIAHTDLRPDNMIVGDGRAWICDWTSPRHMAPWVDTVLLLLTAHADGHDADALFRGHPTAAEVSDEELDTVLAAMSGALLRGWRDRPASLLSPAIDDHMRWSGLAAADWLARRRGW